MKRIVLEGGKYTYVRDATGQYALRYGMQWHDLAGDKFVLAMAERIEELEAELREAKERAIQALLLP